MDNIKQYKRRIGFLREDEREEEEKKARVADHIKLVDGICDELYNAMLIFDQETLEIFKNAIYKILYGDKK